MNAVLAASAPHPIVRSVYLLPPWIVDYLDGAEIAITIILLTFVIQYTFSSPWWRDVIGLTLVIEALGLLAITIPACLVLIWHHLLTVYQSTAISMTVLPVLTLAIAWRCVAFWRVRRPSLDLLRRKAPGAGKAAASDDGAP